jgi:hypothetical protein
MSEISAFRLITSFLASPGKSAVLQKLRQAAVRAIYGWIEGIDTLGGAVTVRMKVPVRFLRRTVQFRFYMFRSIPPDCHISGPGFFSQLHRIPPNLATAIRMHLFIEDFEFPEEEGEEYE